MLQKFQSSRAFQIHKIQRSRHGLALQTSENVFCCETRHLRTRFYRCAANVRKYDTLIVQLEKQMRWWKWLWNCDIQPSCSNLSTLKCIEQVVLINKSSSANIDEYRWIFHFRKWCLIEKTFRFGSHCTSDYNKIRCRQKFVKADILGTHFCSWRLLRSSTVENVTDAKGT